MTRVASRVLEKLSIRDGQGKEHTRGLVVELSPGKVVFYRDVTGAALIQEGYAVEVGLLTHLEHTGVERVHYRVKGGPLLTTTVEAYRTQGWSLNANHRAQLVLPATKWTQYAADLAYDVPVADLAWTVVDHASGETLAGPRALEREVAEAMAGFDEHQAAADLAIERLRTGVLHHPGDVDPVTRDLSIVLDYLMRTDVEARL